jgi:hypothetical protein
MDEAGTNNVLFLISMIATKFWVNPFLFSYMGVIL